MKKQDFLDLGGKYWEKGEIQRVYITAEIFNKIKGTALSDNTNKFWFDCKSEKLMRSYKNKKAEVVSI